ncbi:uncharacterized protein BO97DRAFT_470394 [Aspergillus homomorphus CBS 101889]|uniref:Vacuolar protein sorting-associated protein 62 n=1 Tax=Aspergillus homomorphus (strain CBS 101889) TaxID=1450537 RepID=A0A395I0U8_ASPHC|nr:hypothetical protein BO97DRAFT_470394 [Aspergillus homomorphus CBS 101889]RAL12164.1 hypothetical protein BO97DRAFT_470394 [Aspergillus homomorphus CBS 101889]
MWELLYHLPPLAAESSLSGASTIGLAATAILTCVIEYAPLVWLHSQDLMHTIPMVNWTSIPGSQSPLTLDDLASLNSMGNTSVYLTSKEGIDANPQPHWFYGVEPSVNGVTEVFGTLDAFYFYFFAYKQGNTVLGMQLGNHVGDWEHNMVGFEQGAFTYDATEKKGKRPIAYSANGTHAVYAIADSHDHTIPNFNLPTGLIVDYTDRGLLWDPARNAYAYSYDATSQKFQPYDASFPVNWLEYNGKWGNDALPGGPELFGQAKYTGGPNGSRFKHLVRSKVCPRSPCTILPKARIA